MYCTNCGRLSTQGDKYCIDCGGALRLSRDSQTHTEIIEQTWVRASQTRRFLNYLIDIIGYYIFAFMVGVLIAVGLVATDSFSADAVNSIFTQFNDTFIGLAAIFLYYLVLESAFGRTLGKMITDTKVVDERGNKPSTGIIARRTLARFIPFEAFTFFGSNRPAGWHDSLSKTWVVQVKRKKP